MADKRIEGKMSNIRSSMVKLKDAYESDQLNIMYSDYEDIFKEYKKINNEYQEMKDREAFLKEKDKMLSDVDKDFEEYIDLLHKLNVNSKELEALNKTRIEENIPKKDQGVYYAWYYRANNLQKKILELFLINSSTLDDLIINENVVNRKISEERERANKILRDMPTKFLTIEGVMDNFQKAIDRILETRSKVQGGKGNRAK